MAQKKISFITLGCKVNQYDSQGLLEAADRAGYKTVFDSPHADIFVVNTCTVTEVAAAKSRRTVAGLARRNPQSRMYVTGCMADSHAEELRALAGVDFVVKNAQKSLMVDLFEEMETRKVEPVEFDARAADIFDLGVTRFHGHTRAFLKVQDGCHLNCSYCIIPQVRGDVRSRSIESAVREATAIVQNGYREIVLTGIHLGGFGRDTGESLAELCRRLLALDGLRRLRLSSIEANEVTDELLDVLAGSPKACPHFHVPLQSGSRDVLRLMRRRYHPAGFARAVDMICRRWAEPALTTDVIVGFPGETDAQWRETVELCREIEFMKIHIFPYSHRRKTDATLLPNPCSAELIQQRKTELAHVEEELALAYKRRFVGRTLEVLVEGTRDRQTGRLAGFTANYIRVHLDAEDTLREEFVPVRLTGCSAKHAFGEAVSYNACGVG